MSKLDFFRQACDRALTTEAQASTQHAAATCRWCDAIVRKTGEMISTGELCVEHLALALEWRQRVRRIPPGQEDQLDPLRAEIRDRAEVIYRARIGWDDEPPGGAHAETAAIA